MISAWVSSALAFALLYLVCPSLDGQSKQTGTEAEKAPYQVYDAVLAIMQFPKQDAHILIVNTTLNTGCGPESKNPTLLNGCGIFAPPLSPGELSQVLQASMPNITPRTWQDFLTANAASETLVDSVRTTWPHLVADFSLAPSGIWHSPDGIVFFPKVGFSEKRNQALVYVLFFSYMDNVHTSGTFFLVERDKAGHWGPAGRVTYMETQ